MQAERLLADVDAHGADLDAVRDSFDAWCDEVIAAWVRDHVDMDTGRVGALVRRGASTSRQPLPSDLILAAASQDPGIAREPCSPTCR